MNSYLAFIAGIAVTIAIVTLWNWSGSRDELGMMDDLETANRERNAAAAEAFAAMDKLSRIIDMETPNCAHVGKRMSAVARGEA